MLLCSPNYLNKTSLPLCVLGELESQSLAFSKQTTVWASPANAGSLDLANEIAATFAAAGVTPKFHQGAGDMMALADRTPISAETRETVNTDRTLLQALDMYVAARSSSKDAAE